MKFENILFRYKIFNLLWFRLVVLLLGVFFVGMIGWYVVENFTNLLKPNTDENSFKNNPLILAEEETFNRIKNLMYANPDSARILVYQRLDYMDSTIKPHYSVPYNNILGVTYFIQSDYSNALSSYYKTLEAALERNLPLHIGNLYNNIAVVYIYLGNYQDALEFLQRSKEVYEEMNSLKFIASTQNNIGRIYFEINDMEICFNYFKLAYDGFKKVNDSIGISSVASHLAQYHTRSGNADSAFHYFQEAVQLSLLTENNFGLSTIYLEMANLYLSEDQYAEALDKFQKSESIAKEIKYKSTEFSSLLGLAQVYFKIDKLDEAFAHLNEALSIADVGKNEKQEQEAIRLLSSLHEKKGNVKMALDYLKRAEEMEMELDEHSEYAKVYNLEFQRLIELMASKDLEMKEEKHLSDRRKVAVYGLVIILLITVIILPMIYYIGLNRIRQNQKDKENRNHIKHINEKNQAVMNAEINERRRLSAELHDGVGPLLSLSKLSLSNIIEKNDIDESKRNHLLRSTHKNIEEVLKELKNISNNMSPMIFIDKGLREALKDLALRLTQLRRFEVHLSINGLNSKFKPYVEHALYRTTQEVINNVVKHSECSELNIQVLQDNDELIVMIEDNGKGFDPENLNDNRGMGLKNSRLRIESLRGRFLIDSTPGRGTIVTLILPVSEL